MIDPYDLTKPWDQKRLQEWFLFGICVAGKNARQTADKVEAMLEDIRQNECSCSLRPFRKIAATHTAHVEPFANIEAAINRGKLDYYLRKHKLGQYKRINKAFQGMIKIDPATVTLEELEQIHGIGAKTARMLLLYTRPDQEMIPLDTHILKWMRANGYDAPKSTPPPGKKYRELERAFILEGKLRGLNAKEWDTLVWQQYAKG
jgi:thermostable 8-oxoguanine DNA glycosylase